MQAERFIIRGEISTPNFLPWIARHLSRLGLNGHTKRQSGTCVELVLQGPPDLIDAMELGVSLGPIEAWVDSIERLKLNTPPQE